MITELLRAMCTRNYRDHAVAGGRTGGAAAPGRPGRARRRELTGHSPHEGRGIPHVAVLPGAQVPPVEKNRQHPPQGTRAALPWDNSKKRGALTWTKGSTWRAR